MELAQTLREFNMEERGYGRMCMNLITRLSIAALFILPPLQANAQAGAAAGRVVRVIRGRAPVAKPPEWVPGTGRQAGSYQAATRAAGVSVTGVRKPTTIGVPPFIIGSVQRGTQKSIVNQSTRSVRRQPLRAKSKVSPQPDDPVFVVTNQNIVMNGVMLESVTITARRSTLILMLKADGTFKLSCNDLLSPYVEGLPPSIISNATRANLSMREKHASVFVPNTRAFASVMDKLPVANVMAISPPPPPPPPPPRATTTAQGAKPPPEGDLCKVAGKVCYDPANQKVSASLSCGPVSVSLDTKGAFSVSLKVLG
jgi:hypothetical protein